MANIPLSASKIVGDFLFVSGQVGQQNGKIVSENMKEQTAKAINNLESVLKDNGVSLGDVVDVTVFLVDQADYGDFNEAYSSLFKEPYPTRTTVTVQSLPLGAKVEIKAIASK